MDILEELDLKLAAAFYQQRDGGIAAGIKEILEEWNNWERKDLAEFIRTVLSTVDEEVIDQYMHEHFPWNIEHPALWLKSLVTKLSS